MASSGSNDEAGGGEGGVQTPASRKRNMGQAILRQLDPQTRRPPSPPDESELRTTSMDIFHFDPAEDFSAEGFLADLDEIVKIAKKMQHQSMRSRQPYPRMRNLAFVSIWATDPRAPLVDQTRCETYFVEICMKCLDSGLAKIIDTDYYAPIAHYFPRLFGEWMDESVDLDKLGLPRKHWPSLLAYFVEGRCGEARRFCGYWGPRSMGAIIALEDAVNALDFALALKNYDKRPKSLFNYRGRTLHHLLERLDEEGNPRRSRSEVARESALKRYRATFHDRILLCRQYLAVQKWKNDIRAPFTEVCEHVRAELVDGVSDRVAQESQSFFGLAEVPPADRTTYDKLKKQEFEDDAVRKYLGRKRDDLRQLLLGLKGNDEAEQKTLNVMKQELRSLGDKWPPKKRPGYSRTR